MNLIHSKFNISGALESLPGGRAENQDFMGYADTQLGFVFVLCDGMGGGPAGLTASTTVVDAVIQYLSSYTKEDDVKSAITKSIAFADEKISNLVAKSPEFTGMGTTIVVLIINNKSAHVAHIGDSRLYQFRLGQKVFRTADHSQVGELVRRGELTEEQARTSPNSNIITRAINGCGIAKADIVELPYEKGDRFVLCSDGIWGSMPEKDLIKDFTKTKSVSGTVVKLAFDVDEIGKSTGGKHDNLSIAIVETQSNSKLKVKMGKKIRNVLYTLIALLTISIIANIWSLSSKDMSQMQSTDSIDSLTNLVENLCKDTSSLRQQIKQKEEQIVKQSADTNSIKDGVDEIERLKKENDSLKSALAKE